MRRFNIDTVTTILLISLIIGCAGLTLTKVEADRLQIMSRTAGYFLGYIVGDKADEKLEGRVAEYYMAVRQDGLTIGALNIGLTYLADTLKVNPGLLAEIIYTLKAFGVEFSDEGLALQIVRDIPSEYLDSAASGYRNGLLTAKWEHENG
jgi:hypothetical protein